MSNDTTNVLSDNITMKTIDQKEITKDKLGVTALIAIMNQRLKVSPPEPTNNR